MYSLAVRTSSVPYATLRRGEEQVQTYNGDLRHLPRHSSVFVEDDFSDDAKVSLQGSKAKIVHLGAALQAQLCAGTISAIGKHLGFLALTPSAATAYFVNARGACGRQPFKWRDRTTDRHLIPKTNQPFTRQNRLMLECITALLASNPAIQFLGIWSPTRLGVTAENIYNLEIPFAFLPPTADLQGALLLARG